MKKLLLFLLLALPLFAQNSRIDNVALGPQGPIPFAAVAVCTQPANTATAPCSPLANLCSSITDVVCTSLNPLNADLLGNYHFYAKQSQAPLTIQVYGPQVSTPYVMTDQSLTPGSNTNNTWTGTNLFTQNLVTRNDTNQDLEVQVAGDINHLNLQGEGPSFVAINTGSTGSNTGSFCVRNGTYPGANINGCIHFGFWDGSAWHSYLDFLPAKSNALTASRLRIGSWGGMIVNPSGAGANLDPDILSGTTPLSQVGIFAVQRRSEDNNTERYLYVGTDKVALEQTVPFTVNAAAAIGNGATPVATLDIWAADGGNFFLARRTTNGNSVINALSDGSGNPSLIVNNAAGVAQVSLNGLNGSIDFVEKAASASGGAGVDRCYGDSTAHAIKCIYNNGTYFKLAQVISATSSAFATATTAGTCVQNTTAVTGATTSMAVSASPVSTPGVGAVWSAFVSSPDNVTINECAVATSAGGTIAFNIRVTP